MNCDGAVELISTFDFRCGVKKQHFCCNIEGEIYARLVIMPEKKNTLYVSICKVSVF